MIIGLSLMKLKMRRCLFKVYLRAWHLGDFRRGRVGSSHRRAVSRDVALVIQLCLLGSGGRTSCSFTFVHVFFRMALDI